MELRHKMCSGSCVEPKPVNYQQHKGAEKQGKTRLREQRTGHLVKTLQTTQCSVRLVHLAQSLA